MYSLTISFGPAGTLWAFLFKEEQKAGEAYNLYVDHKLGRGESGILIMNDDFGQTCAIPFADINGITCEDLDLVEAARIYRSLAEERLKIKLQTAAKTDPLIGPAISNRGPGVLTPMGGFRQ